MKPITQNSVAAVILAAALLLSGCATKSKYSACNLPANGLDSTGIYGAIGLVDSDAQRACERRHRYVDRRADLDPAVRERILNGAITVGMTESEVRAAWGRPYRVSRYAAGELDQWIYGYVDYYYNFVPNQFVYFNDGVVVDWQSL